MKAIIALGITALTLGSGACTYATTNPGADLLMTTAATMGIVAGACLLTWGIAIAIHRYS